MSVRSFSRLALVFVVLFAALTAGALVPFQPLDPAWQLRFGATLINAAILPLLALALLRLASLLDPRDPLIRRRWRRFSHLAIGAALGFLLLLPLQISAALRLQASTDPLRKLSELPPFAIACLAIACGFAIFARRPGVDVPLLDDLLIELQLRLPQGLLPGRSRPPGAELRDLHRQQKSN